MRAAAFLAVTTALSGCANSRDAGQTVPASVQREGHARPARIKYFTVEPDNAGLLDITTAPDGALWFTEQTASQIGRLKSGKFKYYPTLTRNAQPRGITTGPDGALWFAEGARKIGRITTSGAVTEFPIPFPAYAITNGFDNALWFTMHQNKSNWIGSVTTYGKVRKFKIKSNNETGESDITAGRDGSYFFTLPSTNQVGRITSSGTIKLFKNGDGDTEPFPILTLGGNFWIGERDGVALLEPRGEFTEYPLPPSSGSGVFGITHGDHGGVWFVVNQGDYIGTVVGSEVQLYKAGPPSAHGLSDLTLGPDDNLWFTDAVANRIGRFTPP